MKSTLLELPPEIQGLAEDSYVDAQSVEELASRANLQDREVIERLLLPGTRFGDYQILGYIAAGGMGEVYAAERIMADGKRLGPVALKVISPAHHEDWAIAARFKREAQISRAIRSPHVIRVYEFGETEEGHAFLSMEMLNGEELFDRLCVQRSLPAEEVAEIVLQVLAGLRAIHESGVIHRDLKPENVYLHRQPDGAEIVKILDFGIAKRADEESDPYLSVVGKIYGTPEYIAPEQGLNPDVDARADLYAVGVLLYECLTGTLPFSGETPYAVILAHQNEPAPELPADVDPVLATIVHRALEKKAADRFQSAEEMAQAIRGWLRHLRDDGLGRTYTGDETGELQGMGDLVRQADKQRPARGSDASTEADAPPVQIFSRPKRRDADADAAERGRATSRRDPDSTQERRAVGTGPRDEAPSSPAARIVTVLMVLAILTAAAWVLYDNLVDEPASEPEPDPLILD